MVKLILMMLLLTGCYHIKIPPTDLKDFEIINIAMSCEDADHISDKVYICKGYVSKGKLKCLPSSSTLECKKGDNLIFYSLKPEDFAKIDAYIQYLYEYR